MAGEMTMAEAAAQFGVSGRTLRYAAAQGHLRARRIGALWVTTAKDVETWLSEGKHTPGRSPAPSAPKRRPGRPRKTVEAPPLKPEPRGPRGRKMTGYERSREG